MAQALTPNQSAMSNLQDRSSTPADRRIRDQKQQEKVVQLWIFIGCVLGFLTLINLFCTLQSYIRKRSPVAYPSQEARDDKEKLPSRTAPSFWMRSLAALATGYRILSFRLLVPISFGSHLLFSEIMFICLYLASLLIWLLVDSTSDPRFVGLVFTGSFFSSS